MIVERVAKRLGPNFGYEISAAGINGVSWCRDTAASETVITITDGSEHHAPAVRAIVQAHNRLTADAGAALTNDQWMRLRLNAFAALADKRRSDRRALLEAIAGWYHGDLGRNRKTDPELRAMRDALRSDTDVSLQDIVTAADAALTVRGA